MSKTIVNRKVFDIPDEVHDYIVDLEIRCAKNDGIEAERERCLGMMKKCYRRCHLQDESIWWSSLTDELCNTLCEMMGDKGFQAWLSDFGWYKPEKAGE